MDEIIKAFIDDRVEDLKGSSFPEDPILTPKISRTASLIASAQKRHNGIIKFALYDFVRRNNNLGALHDIRKYPKAVFFEKVETMVQDASGVFELQPLISRSTSEYEDRSKIDLLIYSPQKKMLNAYIIKRGAAHYDSDSIRGVGRRLSSLKELLSEYKEQYVKNVTVDAYILLYYGGSKEMKRFKFITSDNMDKHFGVGSREKIESANNYYGQRIEKLVSPMIRG